MSAKSKKRRLNKLFFTHPFCHWCGIKVRKLKIPDGKLPKDMATLDHIYSRYDYRRYIQPPLTEVTVLACNECNNKRSRLETASLSKEELRFRSKCHYLFRNVTLVMN